MNNEPIAVVGLSCLFPGVSNPSQFWRLIETGQDVFREVSEQRLGLNPSVIRSQHQKADHTVSTTCAYIEEQVNLDEFMHRIPEIKDWDPYYQWTFHLFSSALKDAGLLNADHSRTGLILGNLAFATETSEKLLEDAMVHALESQFKREIGVATGSLDNSQAHVNLHHTARPAQICGKYFNLGVDPFAIDAACASSLYVVDLACRALWNGQADIMVAMGVNRSEMVAMQVGFSQLGAYSPTHRCKPFDENADGLIVGEGGGALVLKTLSRALADKDDIYCLIMGTGLSGDGSHGGLLTPSSNGQVQAMQNAYDATGINPESIDYLECHGTGTPVGDLVEMQSAASIFKTGRKNPLRIGSVKSMVGHCLSAAGMASLLKVILAIKEEQFPQTLMQEPCEFLKHNQSWIEPVLKPGVWRRGNEPRRAAVSGFGFGGTNAHTIIQEWDPKIELRTANSKKSNPDSVSITAMDCEIGKIESLNGLRTAFFQADQSIVDGDVSIKWPDFPNELSTVRQNRLLADREIQIGRFRMTPREMEHLLPQQLVMLEMTDRCLKNHDKVFRSLLPARTGVVIGLNWHPQLANHTIRLKAGRSLAKLMKNLDLRCDEIEWKQLLSEYKDLISKAVVAEDVIGDIPNFPANRISTEFDFKGPSFVVFQEENSGIKALEIARNYLCSGVVDAMIVGAIDLPFDYKYLLANQNEMESCEFLSDGGAVVVLQRTQDATKEGLATYARVDALSSFSQKDLGAQLNKLRQDFCPHVECSIDPPSRSVPSGLTDSLQIGSRVGYTRAAQGLVAVVASSLMLSQKWLPYQNNPGENLCLPWVRDQSDPARSILLHSSTRDSYHQLIILRETETVLEVEPIPSDPRLAIFGGVDRHEILANMESKRELFDTRSAPENYKFLGIVARNNLEWKERISQSIEHLRHNQGDILDPKGTYFNLQPLYDSGDLAVVYPGFGNVYEGMGRDLLIRFPGLIESIERKTSYTRTLTCSDTLWAEQNPDLYAMSVLEISSSTTILSMALTRLFIDQFGLRPKRVIGFSGGEINSMSALGLWDIDEYFLEAKTNTLFQSIACGDFEALPNHLKIPPIAWHAYLVQATKADIQNLLEGLDGIYLLMVNAPTECMIGGLESICEETLTRGGFEFKRIPMPQIYHSELLKPYKDHLLKLWSRDLNNCENLIFYSHATGESYQPTRETVANALMMTCTQAVFFEPVVRRAYEDGVRIFLELGPNGSVSRYIQKILGDCRYVTIPTNIKERHDLLQLAHAIANLVSHGVRLDISSYSKASMAELESPSNKKILNLPVRTMEVRSDWRGLMNRLRALHKADEDEFYGDKRMNTINELNALKAGDQEANQEANHERLREDFFEAQNRVLQLHQKFLREQEILLQIENGSGSYPSSEGLSETPYAKQPAEIEALFNYEDILQFAHGKISSIFGSEFEIVDSFPYRTRFPSPPYLLVSRVMELEGVTHEFKPSRVVTEFDVNPGDWFLVDNRVPISVCIESGQADLFLISYLGIDHKVQGERVYRLLGADFTFFDSPPEAPCTLRYEIKISSFVEHEGTWLFFFEGTGTCDGKRFIQWVNGCAGYFTPEELMAKASSPAPEIIPSIQPVPHTPVRYCLKSKFFPEDLIKLVSGDLFGCFGPGFEVPFPAQEGLERTAPQWVNPDLRMVDEIEIHRDKGRLGLGYIEAKLNLISDHWYFTSHFVTDNVLPGTLMLDGCTQVMEFFLLYCGLGFQARGGRFQPVQGAEIKVKCRGQVIPGMRDLTYHIEITGIENGHRPRVFANALIRSEGKEVVWIENLGVEVVYANLGQLPSPGHVARDKFSRFVKANELQMLELTTGSPSKYFGKNYEPFDAHRKLSRMPNPPFACITRVLEMHGSAHDFSPGATLTSEMDLFPDDWFFQCNDGILPFCILSEALLQPCGLLAQFLEHDLLSDKDRFIRNLAGKVQTHKIVRAYEVSRLVVKVTLNSATHMPDIFLVSFSGQIEDQEGNLILEGKDLSFGFFTREALSQSPGFALNEGENLPSSEPLPNTPAIESGLMGQYLKMPLDPCLFFDQVLLYSPDGSSAGLAVIETLKQVRPEEWIFYSHFYEDPVMPGSYSLDAITQILKYLMILEGMEAGQLSFTTSPGEFMEWEYKGQIEIKNKAVVYRLELLEKSLDPTPYLRARATVFCDGKAIYRLKSISAALVWNSHLSW